MFYNKVFIETRSYFNNQLVPDMCFAENDTSAEAYRNWKYLSHESGIGRVRITEVYPGYYNGICISEKFGLIDDITKLSSRLSVNIDCGIPLQLGQTVLHCIYQEPFQSWHIIDHPVRECYSPTGIKKIGVCRNYATSIYSPIGYNNSYVSNMCLLSHIGMLTARTANSKEPFDIVRSNQEAQQILLRQRNANYEIKDIDSFIFSYS